MNKGRRKVTISDVAREAGVAKMTVSRVVNGGNYVRAEVQKRVRQAIAKLGYQPNEAARIMSGHKGRTIGLIVPNLGDTFFATCANAVQESAARHGYMVLIQASARNSEVEASAIKMMVSRNVAGLILVPMQVTASAELVEAQAAGMPIVILDRPVNGLKISEVMVDNVRGAEKAVRHLIEHGHTQIACLGYDAKFSSIHQRIEGYIKAMKDHELNPQVWKADSPRGFRGLLERRLNSTQLPTALFTLNNVTTIQTLYTIQEKGIRIPKEIALAGFDDLELASLLSVPVTAVCQSASELGCAGAKLLFDAIQSEVAPKDGAITKLILPTELVIRNSCGCNGGNGV